MFKKIWNIVTTFVVVTVVIFSIMLFGVRLLGIQPYSVLSGSMEPTYHVGSLIYVKKADAASLKSGDVITFMVDNDTIATHRIVEVVPDADDADTIRFRTKGDANQVEDGGLVHCKNVIGTPLFSIPYIGYIAGFIQNPPGLYVAISVCAVMLILAFLPDLFKNDRKKTEKVSDKLSEH